MQDGSKELGLTTSLAISFWSEIAVPTGSVLTIKLPTNMLLDASVVMMVNNEIVATTVS